MAQNAPNLYIYGQNAGKDDRAAKIRISFTRERDDRRSRPEGEWTCRNVGLRIPIRIMKGMTDLASALLTTSQLGKSVFAARQIALVSRPANFADCANESRCRDVC
jgi:hypothetical protein